jgi:hypothetical protein
VSLLNQTTDDQGAVAQGSVEIPTNILDASGAIPLFLAVTAYGLSWFNHSFHIGLWNKTFIVASLMALIKGFMDVVTIMPDSIGWESCKERLQPSGLEHIRSLHFLKDFWSTFFSAAWHEIIGNGHGGRIRYCADMMVSGHTYFAALFSLSAYKQVAHNHVVFPGKANMWCRRLVMITCVVCIVVELLLVAAARFHYTVDMLMSLLLVGLLFDSSCVEQISADWSEGFQFRCKDTFKPRSSPLSSLIRSFSGDVDPKTDPAVPAVLPSRDWYLQSSHSSGHRAMGRGA